MVFLVGIALVAPAVVNPIADWASRPLERRLRLVRERSPAATCSATPDAARITVTAVMLGLASIVAMISVVTSIFAGFTSYLDKSLSADYLLIPQSIILGQGNVAAGPRLADEVRHAPGIAARLDAADHAGAAGRRRRAGDRHRPGTYLKVAAFDWNAGSSDAAVTSCGTGRWLIANGIYAAQHNLVVGQAVLLDTPNGPPHATTWPASATTT